MLWGVITLVHYGGVIAAKSGITFPEPLYPITNVPTRLFVKLAFQRSLLGVKVVPN